MRLFPFLLAHSNEDNADEGAGTPASSCDVAASSAADVVGGG